MSNTGKTLQPIGVREFISQYAVDDTLFTQLPEFSFIKRIAVTSKNQGCGCGLNAEIQRAILTFNEFVQEVDSDLVNRVKVAFNTEKVCFTVQIDGNFSVKCYS